MGVSVGVPAAVYAYSRGATAKAALIRGGKSVVFGAGAAVESATAAAIMTGTILILIPVKTGSGSSDVLYYPGGPSPPPGPPKGR